MIRLMALPSAMSSFRSELRVEDGPNGVSRRAVLPLSYWELSIVSSYHVFTVFFDTFI